MGVGHHLESWKSAMINALTNIANQSYDRKGNETNVFNGHAGL